MFLLYLFHLHKIQILSQNHPIIHFRLIYIILLSIFLLLNLNQDILSQRITKLLMLDPEIKTYYNTNTDNMLLMMFYRIPKERVYRKLIKYRYLYMWPMRFFNFFNTKCLTLKYFSSFSFKFHFRLFRLISHFSRLRSTHLIFKFFSHLINSLRFFR